MKRTLQEARESTGRIPKMRLLMKEADGHSTSTSMASQIPSQMKPTESREQMTEIPTLQVNPPLSRTLLRRKMLSAKSTET